jgi:catechol 2,3-dioxygenase-like lactoylglutathione lyase family enzyme
MAILTLDHVLLTMPPGSEDRAIGFYCGVLGFRRVPKPEPMRAAGGAWFRTGSVELHLGADADFIPARRGHPAFLVDGLDDLAKDCEAAGHAVTWDERYPGFRRFYAHDPFGNRLEFLQPEN